MTNEDLDEARAIEAHRRCGWKMDESIDTVRLAARLAREGWKPECERLRLEAQKIAMSAMRGDCLDVETIALAALRRGIELGREGK